MISQNHQREPTTPEYIEVRSSKVHGRGVFAAKDIPKRVRIIEYVGEKISKVVSDKRGDEQINLATKNSEEGAVYIFELNEELDLDGNFSWNTARLINHSCSPIVKDINTKNEKTISFWYQK